MSHVNLRYWHMFRLILNETSINSLNSKVSQKKKNSLNSNVSPFSHALSLSQMANQIINPQQNPSLPPTVFQFSKQKSLSLSLKAPIAVSLSVTHHHMLQLPNG